MPASVLDTACAALRSFVHLSGALRAQAFVPGPPPAIVSCVRLGPLEVEIAERTVSLPHDAQLEAPPPDLGPLRPMPPFEVSARHGEVTGMIGGLQTVADAVMRVAEAIGPGAAVVVELETTAPDEPLAVAARPGEPLLVVIGEEEFEL